MPGDFFALRTELTTDPLARGYSSMTALQAAASLNTVDRDGPWLPLTSSQLFEAIDAAEFTALSTAMRARVDRLLSLGGDIQTAPGAKARSELVAVFGGGSQTIANLLPLAHPQISRGQEIGFPNVFEADVAHARSL